MRLSTVSLTDLVLQSSNGDIYLVVNYTGKNQST